MRNLLHWLFGSGPEREVKQLNRDAAAVIEAARASYRTEIMRGIAQITRDRVRQCLEEVERDSGQMGALLERTQALHREARRGNRQMELTAHTLSIIYLRSLAHGEACAPARATIDALIAEWEHALVEPRDAPM